MGSGHFLVEACRFLGEKMYEACRLCDEQALEIEQQAEKTRKKDEREKLLKQVAELRQRVIDLPDPDDEIVRYLPSRSPEGSEFGVSQRQALALCKRMVAVHCLYGVDKNPLAVELAKLSLWIESHAEGLPLTFVDHRLVVGDSLTGPFFEKLRWNPGNGELVSDLFRQNVDQTFTEKLRQAIQHVHLLEASVGVSLSEMEEKRRLKAELDKALRPFQIVAAAWSGGVMLGLPDCDDHAYGDLMKVVGKTGDIPEQIESERLRTMIARGLGVDDIPPERNPLYALMNGNGQGSPIPALPYDLAFPGVFYPTGVPFDRRGFDVMLGNPPWDQEEIAEAEFWASFDLGVLDTKDPDERVAIQNELRQDPERLRQWERYVAAQEQLQRLTRRIFTYQVVKVAGKYTSGKPDAFRLFAERFAILLAQGGRIGAVFPSAFYANEGVTGIRRLYFSKLSIPAVYGFINSRAIFDIHRSFKFVPLVAQRHDGGTNTLQVLFGLSDPAILFEEATARYAVDLDYDTVARIGGEHLILPEIPSHEDLLLLVTAGQGQPALGTICAQYCLDLRQGMSTTRERHRRVALGSANTGVATCRVHEGKTITDYSDQTDTPVTEVVPVGNLPERAHWRTSARYYRVAQRRIARSTDTKTCILAFLTPETVCLESLRVEATPNKRPTHIALAYLAIGNAFPFDYLSRLLVSAAAASEFVMDLVPCVDPKRVAIAVSHAALRLTCNHDDYEAVWREQLGDEWREDRPPFTWPVLEGDDARWAVRAAIDAVVADAYGLSREQYVHVLSTFSHASYLKAPVLCLARFDELKSIGIDAFTKKHDPYWDIPLNESLPKPVIDLPIPSKQDEPGGQLLLGQEAERRRRSRRKR